MYERVMTLREEPLIIATLHGPIEIHRAKGTNRDDRKLRIILPTGLKCVAGLERALAHTPWIQKIDGVIAPKREAYAASPDNAGGVRLTPLDQATPPKPVEPRPVIRVRRTG